MKTLNLISIRWVLIMVSTLIGFATLFTACQQQSMEELTPIETAMENSIDERAGYQFLRPETVEFKGWGKVFEGNKADLKGKDIKLEIMPSTAVSNIVVNARWSGRKIVELKNTQAWQTKVVEVRADQLTGSETHIDIHSWTNFNTTYHIKVYVRDSNGGGNPPPTGNANLVTPNPTTETVALWNYLKGLPAQNKILAGIWDEGNHYINENGFTDIRNRTGKYAALFSDDMWCWQPYGSQQCIDVQQRVINNCINHAKNRGIVSVTWHWGNPFKNQFNRQNAWVDHGGALANWQWNDILKPGTWAHGVVINDIDRHVNAVLKKIKFDDGTPIPILFRPLHEIDGGWFWWTNKNDPAKTKALWNLVYNRIVHHHGMRNLIWVWSNSEMAASRNDSHLYYPGDNTVDMLATDIYHIDFKYSGKRKADWNGNSFSYRDFYDILQDISPNKPKALGECDALPNPTKIQNGTREFDVPWVYALPWWSPADKYNGSCYHNPCNASDWASTTYWHNLYLTLDELPNVYNR